MSVLYTAHATTTKGREGHTKTDDGKLDLELSAPGGKGNGTNPEQLFAAGYSACFGSACAAVAQKEKIDAGEITVEAAVNLNKDDSGYFISAELTVSAEKLDEKATQSLIEKAHQMCPYSKATRGNVEVQLKAKASQKKAA